MRGNKVLKIALDDFGSFLSAEKGCLVVKDREGNAKRYPLGENELGEIQLKSGNGVSVGALVNCCFWDVNVILLTSRGNPIGMLHSFGDDSHVLTRICQYDALKSVKALEIAKQFVKSKIEGQNIVLKKYGLKTDTSVRLKVNAVEANSSALFIRKLMQIEAKFSQFYFRQIFQLIQEKIRPESRRTFKAYDGVNNLLNLAYSVLSWKVYIALIRAKLEPYLGFLHSVQFGKPSLVCDFEELYRYLIDDFVIQYALSLKEKDFVLKEEAFSSKRKGKRQYLNAAKNSEFLKRLNLYFTSKIEIPRIKVGKKQEIETLIAEEALLFAKYLRGEKTCWTPRIAELR